MEPKGANEVVLVALGSNLGDSPALLRAAMDRITQAAGVAVRRSSLWSTSPVDCPPESPRFINAALVFPIPPGYSPETWLATTQDLEREFGRTPKTVVNEARRMDIDLIAWGEEVRCSAFLTLPHPRAHLRRFVLQPLAELLPDFVLPGQTKSIAELLVDSVPDPLLQRVNA